MIERTGEIHANVLEVQGMGNKVRVLFGKEPEYTQAQLHSIEEKSRLRGETFSQLVETYQRVGLSEEEANSVAIGMIVG